MFDKTCKWKDCPFKDKVIKGGTGYVSVSRIGCFHSSCYKEWDMNEARKLDREAMLGLGDDENAGDC